MNAASHCDAADVQPTGRSCMACAERSQTHFSPEDASAAAPNDAEVNYNMRYQLWCSLERRLYWMSWTAVLLRVASDVRWSRVRTIRLPSNVWFVKKQAARKFFYILQCHLGLLSLGVWIRLWENLYSRAPRVRRRWSLLCGVCLREHRKSSFWDIAAYICNLDSYDLEQQALAP